MGVQLKTGRKNEMNGEDAISRSHKDPSAIIFLERMLLKSGSVVRV